MGLKAQYFAAAAVILALGGSSCKGRYAEASPSGETVEVRIAEPASDGCGQSDGGVTTEVVTVSQPVEKK